MKQKEIDYSITFLPFILVAALCMIFFVYPHTSTHILEEIRTFFNKTLGSFYLAMGLGMFFISLFIAFSKYGNIKLGGEKKEHSNFTWGSMMFTAGLAADILFYSLCEWILYAREGRIAALGDTTLWSGTYPLFHWGPIPWSFYLVLACAFGFMLHVRKRTRQKYSEACRPLLKDKTDGIWGKLIDLIAVFALIAGTATTFSLATPLLSQTMGRIFSLPDGKAMSIALLLVVCGVYTFCAYFGIKSVAKLAAGCIYLFFALLAYVFLGGGQTRFILENGLASLGNLAQNFLTLSTYTDPTGKITFSQDWTCFYWAYWMVWCVATPFFIGSISKGRTLKQVVLGGYVFGLSGTFLSFIILGNFSLGLFASGKLDVLAIYEEGQNLYHTIGEIMNRLPFPPLVLLLLALTMITFYATTFDSLTLVAASYSYKDLGNRDPSKKIKLYWAILLILLPIALLFADNSMSNLQTVSIIAAFPIGIIMILMIASFFLDARAYLDHEK